MKGEPSAKLATPQETPLRDARGKRDECRRLRKARAARRGAFGARCRLRQHDVARRRSIAARPAVPMRPESRRPGQFRSASMNRFLRPETRYARRMARIARWDRPVDGRGRPRAGLGATCCSSTTASSASSISTSTGSRSACGARRSRRRTSSRSSRPRACAPSSTCAAGASTAPGSCRRRPATASASRSPSSSCAPAAPRTGRRSSSRQGLLRRARLSGRAPLQVRRRPGRLRRRALPHRARGPDRWTRRCASSRRATAISASPRPASSTPSSSATASRARRSGIPFLDLGRDGLRPGGARARFQAAFLVGARRRPAHAAGVAALEVVGELQPVQAGIGAAAGDELLVAAGLGDRARPP